MRTNEHSLPKFMDHHRNTTYRYVIWKREHAINKMSNVIFHYRLASVLLFQSGMFQSFNLLLRVFPIWITCHYTF